MADEVLGARDRPSKELRRKAWLSLLQPLLVILVVLAVLLPVNLILYHQSSNHGLLKNVDTSTKIIVDCTNPTGKCFKDGQANQVAVLQHVEDIVVLAAACAKQEQNATVIQIRNCVEAGLK